MVEITWKAKMTHTLICEIFSKCLLYESWDERNSLKICGWNRQYETEAFQQHISAKMNTFQICCTDWNTPTATNYLTLFLHNFFLPVEHDMFLASNMILIRSEFHHINAEGFLRQSLSIMLSPRTSDLVSSASVVLRHAHVCNLNVCVYIMLPGVDVTDAHYASLFMSPAIVIDIM